MGQRPWITLAGMWVRLAPALIVAILLSACRAAGPTSPAASASASAPPSPHACDAREGSVTDVANEPDWRQFAEYTPWTTPDGCLLRIDVIADRPGPEHCGMESARVIITGRPIGTPYTVERDSAQYVRDPEDVFNDPATAEAFDADADLPAGAVDTEYRQGSVQLWVDPADPASIYLVDGATVERWPLDPQPAGCI